MLYKAKGDKVHELKILNKYFDEIYFESKTFEVRKDDRGFNVADILILKEVSEAVEDGVMVYTGRELFVSINYILRDEEYCKKGYCVLGLQI